jgi:hypothetical protein
VLAVVAAVDVAGVPRGVLLLPLDPPQALRVSTATAAAIAKAVSFGITVWILSGASVLSSA